MEKHNATNQVNNFGNIGMFDLSRGGLILFVILGHSVTLFIKYWEVESELPIYLAPLLLLKFFVYGIIPMFFMMSGYGFRKQKMKRCLRDRVHYLFKPYACVAIVVTLLAIVKKVLLRKPIVEALIYQSFPFLIGLCPGETNVFGLYVASIGPMWFLVALALSWIGLNVLFQLKKEKLRIICIIIVVFICTRLRFYALIPFCFIQALCCMGYLYIGYRVKKERLLWREISNPFYIILILLMLVIVPFGNVDVSQNVWRFGLIDYVASCVAGFCMLRVSIRFENMKGGMSKLLRLMGKNSLFILCVHSVEYLVFPWDKVVNLLGMCPSLGILCVVVIRVIMIGIGTFCVIRLTRRYRYKSRMKTQKDA